MDDDESSNEGDETSTTGDGLDDLVESLKERQRTGDPDLDVASDETASPPDPVEDLLEDAEPDAPATSYDTTPLDEIGDPENVLVLGPLNGELCDKPCTNLLTRSADQVENVLYITATHKVENRLNALQTYSTQTPRRVGIIRIGGNENRQERASVTTTTGSGPEDISVFRVNDPSDLTRLGITVTRYLSDVTENPGRTGLCVHSLSALLQYVDRQRLFRFLHILNSKADDLEVVQHFHMNPAVHDAQTVAVFRTLFDTIVEVDEDGTTRIST